MAEPATQPPTLHFLTAALDEGHPGALTDHADTLRLVWRACRDRYPFTLTAGVILPDHLHCIVALPAGDRHGTVRWRLLQELFQHVVSSRPAGIQLDAQPLRDATEVERRIDYIHGDPVRHGMARTPQRWPYSSLHAYIAEGLRPVHWSCGIEASYGGRSRS